MPAGWCLFGACVRSPNLAEQLLPSLRFRRLLRGRGHPRASRVDEQRASYTGRPERPEAMRFERV